MVQATLSCLVLLSIACFAAAIPGGWESVSTSNPDIKKAANVSVNQISMGNNSPFAQRLITITSAKAQVVAGMNYNITLISGLTKCLKSQKYTLSSCQFNTDLKTNAAYECNVQVWRKLDGTYNLQNFNCKNSNLTVALRSAGKSNTGSFQPISTTDPKVIAVADFFVKRMSQGMDSLYSLKRVNIQSASVQVVAGLVYNLTLSAGYTKCLKRQAQTDLSLCDWNPSLTNEAIKCLVKIFVPLRGKPSPLSQQCTQAPLDELLSAKNSLAGGWQPMKTSDAETIQVATKAISHVSDQLEDIPNRLKLVNVVKAAYQIVAGKKYSLVVDFGTTECLKSEEKPTSLESCKLLDLTYATRCTVTVLSQPWLHNFQVTVSPDCRVVKLEVDPQLVEDLAHFNLFKATYGKTYESEQEEKKRFMIFKANQEIIRELRQTERGTGVYGNTVFADLTREEFELRHLGFKPSLATSEKLAEAEIPKMSAIPASFDWRQKKAVTEVKNQGTCGSCWAFSTTGNIEGQWAIKKKQLVSLSEQELVDCDKVDQGCNGGLPSNAYKQIIKLGGLETEKAYPYEGTDDKCSLNKKKVEVYINSSVAISKNETEMAQWLVKNGPISIGINAMAMQFYFGGVSHPWKIFCNPNNLDHGVLIVGYGTETTSILHRKLPYWIVKNSWGSSWGEQGYYRVYRGDGTCGLNRMPTSAVIN